ncbi:MAG TPA: DUF1178 family protein [Acidiferrobacteraceae bacterium]|nr:DUF1178 family protein [Acidiferrobacteraceae bacterium]HEX19533.1 DUF1178 family protein [Acidiferrobacteraceae bacterium]
MIIYDLKCSIGHKFEGWFSNPEDYQHQLDEHMLVCPMCGDEAVKKLPTASKISSSPAKIPSSELMDIKEAIQPDVAREFLGKLHEYVDQNYDDVGARFSEEARKIHYGEAEGRNIRGLATADEVQQLHEEGVTATTLPPKPIDKKKLN